MLRLRAFLRRHILWVGFLAVIVPLLVILALQYQSLNKLKQTSSVAENVWMKNYLADVSKEVKYFYKSNAEQILTTPASALSTDGQSGTQNMFGKCEVEGAKLLFIVALRGDDKPAVSYYNPANVKVPKVPTADEARAVNLAKIGRASCRERV